MLKGLIIILFLYSQRELVSITTTPSCSRRVHLSLGAQFAQLQSSTTKFLLMLSGIVESNLSQCTCCSS
nr:unnamed protein product [Ipomoea batatas]